MKKKDAYAFLIKKHLYMLDYAKYKKHLATAKQLIRKHSACYLKIRQFFYRVNVQIDLSSPPNPVLFSSLFKALPLPPPCTTKYFLNDPQQQKKTISKQLPHRL